MANLHSVLLEALIKGGEGSGHFNHDGIPEHQGGSLPSYGRTKPAEAKVRRTKAKKAKAAYALPVGNASPVDDVLEAYGYDHPYLEMYVGPKPAYGDEGGWLYRMRGQRKNEIVTRLSQGTGIPYDECNAFIKQWSISSNDSDVASLTIQEIAAEEFGAGLTEWQQANYDSVKTTRNYIIDRAIAPSQPGDPFDGKEAAYRVYSALESAMPNVTLPFEKPALKAFMEKTLNANTPLYPTEAAFRAALAKVETESRAKTRKALRFTYDETQKQLKAAGISEIHLYRGAVLEASETTGMVVGEATTMASNALSSWSFSRGIAQDFAGGYGSGFGGGETHAVIVDAIVPASRIYATAVTGPGCLTEWEMITIGSPADTVRVYAIDNKRIKKSAPIKGGPGSGHFDHDGIPEHQGGSLPSYGRTRQRAPAARKDNPKGGDPLGAAPKSLTPFGLPKGAESPVDDVLDRDSYDHPYLEMFVGKVGDGYAAHQQVQKMRGVRKGEIVGRLSEKAGLPYADANAFIKQWSIAANDSDMASLTIQELAAEEFGTKLSDYQQRNVDETKARRQSVIDRVLDQLPDTQIDAHSAAVDLANELGYETAIMSFEDTALGAVPDQIVTKAQFRKLLAGAENASRANVRKALQFTYAETQRQLAAAGIKEIRLFRGAAISDQGLTVGEAATVQSNALSSWAFARGPAEIFSDGHMNGASPRGTKAVIFDAIVPASRIYATATSGPGCLTEWEMIVIGGQADGVRVYSIDEKRTTKSAAIKGGEGSGHFGHAGIPEHQGGSLPSKGPKGQSVGNTTKPKLAQFTIPTTMEKPVDVALNYADYDHPLITMLAGKFDKSKLTEDFMEDDWLEATGDSLKARVVNRLVEGAGLSYDEANDFVRQWAVSSNDSDMASLGIQAVAAKTLGTQLTPWQKAKLEQLQIARRSVISRVLDDLDKPDLFTGEVDPFDPLRTVEKVTNAIATDNRDVFGVFERQALRDYVDEEKQAILKGRPSATRSVADIRKRLDAIVKENDRKVADAVRFTYNETQAALAKAGIKEIHVYRGAALPTEALGFATSGDLAKVASNALSSWSMAYGVADEFSNNIQDDYRSTIIDTVVPASRIYSMPHTGPGCLNEWEVIVIGSKADRVRVRKNQAGRYFSPGKSWAETQALLTAMVKGGPSLSGVLGQASAVPLGGLFAGIIKGGEGSGHFGHAGIPEHQGGSLPGKGPKAKAKPKPDGDWGPGKKLPKIGDQPLADPRLVAELGVEEFTPDYAHRDHPLMRLWAAGEPVFASEHAGPDLYHGFAKGPMMKREQARMRQIAKVTGTTKADAENFLTTWLESSNNKHLGSLAIQEEAAGLWDAPLSDWQAEKLGAAKAAREKRVDQIFTLAERYHETTDDVFEQILSGFKTTELYPFEGDMRKRYLAEKKAGQVIRTREAALAWLADSEAKGREATRKALAFVYQNTQAAFAEAGITHVMGYRGTSGTPDQYAKYEAGDTLAFQGNTLSSWSLSRRVVNNLFSSPGLESVSVGLEAAIPVERIISSAVTGFGATGEWEVVVLGNTDADSGHIYQIKYPPSYKKSMKGGPGSGFRDHEGRPGLQGGSLPSIEVEFDGRVWNGETHEGGTVLSKLDTGKMGEDAVIDILSQIYGVPFGTVNVKVNNAPFDVVGDHHAVEVKTGLATNGKTAQQWRATIGQPGKKETELLKNMDPAQKRAHNEWKMKAILDRKHALLDKMSADAGQPMRPRTMGLIMSGDGARADVFSFEGFHLRLPWNKHATNEHYLGTYDFKAKKMHWKNGEKPIKAVPYFVKNTTQSGATMKSLIDKLTGKRGTPVQAAALAAIDADFDQVYAWWTAHYNPKTGLPRTEKRAVVDLVQVVPGHITMSILAQLTKGGDGSGYTHEAGHRGRPGLQGGSLPAPQGPPPPEMSEDEAFPDDDQFMGEDIWIDPALGSTWVTLNGRTILAGHIEQLEAFGFTTEDVADVTDLGEGKWATVEVTHFIDNGTEYLRLKGEWFDGQRQSAVGEFSLSLQAGGKEAKTEIITIDPYYMKKGMGTTVANGVFAKLAAKGYEKALFVADLTIGRYAWAREGAQYVSAAEAARQTDRFRYWAREKGLQGGLKGRMPVFTNPQDVANYKHPDGVTLRGKDILNTDVAPDMVLPLGKAFMLDDATGHLDWEAYIPLKQWRSKSTKAAPKGARRAGRGNFVITGRAVPGGSDALFWAQYLTEEEGDPLLDLADGVMKAMLLTALIKGGPGSGNFSATHIGRPGKRGGSADDGVPNASAQAENAPQGRKLTAGALTPARGGNAAQRPAGAPTVAPSASGRGVGGRVPVDFRDPRQVSQAVTGFLQASPTFAAALKTKGPLAPAFLATPQGQAPGSQHLPTLMKELGIAANKPTVKPLKLGAKSLFFPSITSDAELNALLFKVPPDPAHSSGFWVPGKAAGGGAHGQLKEGAKAADGKKVEQARKKEEAKVKPVMINALLMAGLTGDYSQANLLQLHYQLVGNLGTFSLLMGYPTLNFGMQTGTVVFDRAELEVDPNLVPRQPLVVPEGRVRKRRGVGQLIKGNE